MTERLYYTDAYLTEFEAQVVDVTDAAGRTAVILDRTAFYPSSGGQPFDTGSLGDTRVVDVVDADDGRILHVVTGEPPRGAIKARIDWERRFEHMQQHTGQHVLSAAFDRLLGVRTLSFHLGSGASTIDLAREVTPGEIAAAEDLANKEVWRDVPVIIRFLDSGEAASLPLRKEPSRSGPLRIVEVQGFDVSACGGTHVATTGGIGLIAVSSWERFKGGSRLEFRCGVRALAHYRTVRDGSAAAGKLLSASSGDLVGAVERTLAENRDLRRQARDLQERLAGFEADALAASAADIAGMRLVVSAVADADVTVLKSLAQRIASRAGFAAILLTAQAPVSVAIARAPGLRLDAAALLKELLSRFGGKGGGRPELAQGGGLNATPADVGESARRIVGAPERD